MPYVDPYSKKTLDEGRAPETPGELNYCITQLLIGYASRGLNLRYDKINDCLGACEGAKAEFYRRVATPYEDNKIIANGDVYPKNLTGEG